MKILYHHRIASKDGQYVHIEEIVNALRNLGHEVILVGPDVAENTDFGSDGGWVTVLRQKFPKALTELLEFGYSAVGFMRLLKAVWKHKPDVIYERYNLYYPAGIWVKALTRLPLVLEVNSPLYDERLAFGGLALPKLARWSEHYVWKRADHVLPVSHVLAGFIQRAGVDEAKISVVPNGIDPDKFLNGRVEAEDEPEADPVPGDLRTHMAGKLVVGFVGFCREWHRLDKVLERLAEHPRKDLYLLVVGDGPVSEMLQKKARDLSMEDRFCLTGLVTREAMPGWLDCIDIAIQPSVTPWASPLKLIEYLAKGTAIVAADTPNLRELLEDGRNALLFPPDDLEQMLLAIDRIIEDEALCHSLKVNAVETIRARNLTWQGNAEKIIAVFDSLIGAEGKEARVQKNSS